VGRHGYDYVSDFGFRRGRVHAVESDATVAAACALIDCQLRARDHCVCASDIFQDERRSRACFFFIQESGSRTGEKLLKIVRTLDFRFFFSGIPVGIMFPPVVAVRLRQNEDEHRAPVGLRRVSVSRPAPSRRSPEPSECVVALEVNATQLQGARVSQTMPATSCDEQRYPQGSSPPTSHHASTVRQPHETQTDSLHSIQRLPASTVNSYFIDEDSTLPTNFKEWRRQQVTMTTSFDGPEMIDSGIGHVTAYPSNVHMVAVGQGRQMSLMRDTVGRSRR
jgi:hypothetical protein